MNENQKYKLRYEQLRDNNPAKKEIEMYGDTINENEFYETPGHNRTICFAWPDGREMFLNYSYLVSGELTVNSETNQIALTFTSHVISLKGYNLTELWHSLMAQRAKLVKMTDSRYQTDTFGESVTICELLASKV